MAEMPSVIKVGPFRYRVVLDVQKLREDERRNNDPANSQFGHCRHGTLEIVMDPANPPDQMADTLWHEIKHAVANLSACDGQLEEEEWIGRTAPMELAVLRDNPALVAFLVDEAG